MKLLLARRLLAILLLLLVVFIIGVGINSIYGVDKPDPVGVYEIDISDESGWK